MDLSGNDYRVAAFIEQIIIIRQDDSNMLVLTNRPTDGPSVNVEK